MEGYEIVSNIGKGSSGSVFLAKSRKLKKLVAIKEIEIDENRRSRCKKSVVREASILKRLSHRSIVECYEWFLSKNDTLMHIVLEYCSGGTMQDKVKIAQSRKDYFAEHKVLKWIADITSAVAFMHERRILHRDLKTENVFLVKPEIAKLGDFGISKEIDHTLDLAQTCVGTPCYLSPELCQDIPYNSKSDIWALGCLLFEITALKPAFDAANLVSLFYKIVKGDFATLPDGCPENISILVKLILQKDPDQRPTAAELLKHPALSPYIEAAAGSVSYIVNDTGKQKPPKLAELRNKHGAVERLNSQEILDPAKDDAIDRTISPGPNYAYNMFLSGVKSKSTLQDIKHPNKLHIGTSNVRSNSVLEKNADALRGNRLVLPQIVGIKENSSTGKNDDTVCEVETARPQTCPHSASKRVAEDYTEDTFTDTVVTWSGYGDRGSRHPSGHVRHRNSSFSSDSDVSSSTDSDDQCETARSINFQDGALEKSRMYSESDSDSSKNYDSDEIAEDFIRDEPAGDDEIPEMIETCGDGEELTLASSTNGNEAVRSLGDNARVLPGSAWLRSKRVQVMQQSGIPVTGAGDNMNPSHRKKARLPGSSWLSRDQRNTRQESSSDEAIVLGENTSKMQVDKGASKRNAKNFRRNHELPGSAWLKNSNSTRKAIDSNNTNKPQQAKRGKSMILESCSSSASEMGSPEKGQTDSDLDATNYSYPDDFDEYEDDFEPSDDESDGEVGTSATRSSLNVVRQGCIDLLGDDMFKDLSSLFQRGLTLSEVMHKFKRRKVDTEAVETCYLLLQKLP